MPTQKIPAWSAQLTANAPKEWRAAIGRAAFKAKVSTSEFLRRLIARGAALECPKLSKALVESHRRYYPARQIMASVMLLVLAAGAVANGHLKHCRVAPRLRVRQDMVQEVAA